MHRPIWALAFLCIGEPAIAQDISAVAMRDGIELHTRVYKRSEAPRPVILIRTPYGAAAAAQARVFNLLRSDAEEFNESGYVYVTQDLRGTGLSQGGATVRFIADQADTRDTLDWITQQPWSDGNVAMWGVSAPGIVANLALQNPHPSLKCTATVISAADVHTMLFPGGAYREELGSGWLPVNAGSGIEELFLAQEERGPWWDEGIIADSELPPATIKTLMFVGAFDIFNASGIALHQRLVARSAPDENHILFVGPWAHDSVTPTRNADLAGAFSGDLKFELQAFAAPGFAIDPRVQFFSFLGWCLRGGGRPNARVRAYRMHINDAPDLVGVRAQGSWAQYASWPPPASRTQRMMLYRDGSMGEATSNSGAPLTLASDPGNPVPTRGGAVLFANNQSNVKLGPRNEADLLERSDVLLFETQSATRAVDVVGNARAEIWAASSTTDIDVHVKVYLKTAQAEYFLMTDGARRGRFVGGLDRIRALTPGVAAKFAVEFGPLSFRLRPGQAVAVAVQASNHSRFSMNPQLAEPLIDRPQALQSTLTLELKPDEPSFIDLPLLLSQLPVAQPPPAESTDAGDSGTARDGGSKDSGNTQQAPGSGCSCKTTSYFPEWSLVFALLLLAMGPRRK